MADEWLTLSATAKYLGIAPTTARKWADEGRIAVHRTPGGHRRFLKADLDAYIGRDTSSNDGNANNNQGGLNVDIKSRHGGKPEALIIDDDKEILELLHEVFKIEGFVPRCVTSAISGIKEINKRMPDVVLLDIAMPGMDGLEMLKKIREKVELNQLPVLVFSGVVDKTELRRALRYGAKGWAAKPFDPFQLVNQARGLLIASIAVDEQESDK